MDLVFNNFTRCTKCLATVDIEKVGTGGASGGSYTPEKMVWEDVNAERALDTVYTNTNDVPIICSDYTVYIQEQIVRFYIDGEELVL